MRKLVFLFISIFSLVTLELGTTSGSTKLDKPIMVIDTIAIKTVKVETVVDSLVWKKAEASYYNPRDSRQTKKNPDGKGTSGETIKSGSVSFGSTLTRTLFNRGFIVFIQVKDCDVITPYGKGIFRIDDMMGSRYNNKENKFYIDFFHKDVNSKQKHLGRFKVKFRIFKIIKPDGDLSSSGFLFL